MDEAIIEGLALEFLKIGYLVGLDNHGLIGLRRPDGHSGYANVEIVNDEVVIFWDDYKDPAKFFTVRVPLNDPECFAKAQALLAKHFVIKGTEKWLLK